MPFRNARVDSDTLELNMHVICSIAVLQSRLDYFKESLQTELIQTIINSIISQTVTLDEQAPGKFIHCKLKTFPSTWERLENWKD